MVFKFQNIYAQGNTHLIVNGILKLKYHGRKLAKYVTISHIEDIRENGTHICSVRTNLKCVER
jgi:hypothetical protein